uniref:Uncharacterized protein n=1 Tax=Bracon brevicornis TaxID=1563983 RepID=A0A6V7HYA1_9HYME
MGVAWVFHLFESRFSASRLSECNALHKSPHYHYPSIIYSFIPEAVHGSHPISMLLLLLLLLLLHLPYISDCRRGNAFFSLRSISTAVVYACSM